MTHCDRHFFTHAFVTGLLGAADADHDGAVVLDEAYRYAYGTTLCASSQTWERDTTSNVRAREFENNVLTAHVSADDLQLDLYHAWQIACLTLGIGLGAGASLFVQRFDTPGRAPSRLSAAPSSVRSWLALGKHF